MHKALSVTLTLVLVALFALPVARADVPENMNVQGRLTDAAGDPVSPGLKNFTFKIFDQPVGGVEIWPSGTGELQTIPTDADGLWNAAVGAVIPLNDAVFRDTSRWLEVAVDDGINPPETLPRIKLNTDPFTYRAATAQNADALEGLTLPDLANQFVDESGDVMSGPLLVPWPHGPDDVPNLLGENLRDGVPGFARAFNTWGVFGDAASNTAEGKFATYGHAAGGDGQKTGVLGYAEGTGSLNIGVYGIVVPQATLNYSGWFRNGDFVVENPANPGDQGVQLPDNSIARGEILDEPGIASQNNAITSNYELTAAMTDIQTVEITIPTRGYIHVMGNVYCWIQGAAGNNAVGLFQIDETAGGSAALPYYRAVGEYSKSAGNSFRPVYVDRVYLKNPGTYTFRIEGQTISLSGSGGIWTVWPMLTAIYYPGSYGPVEAVVPIADAGAFEQARPIVAQSGSGGVLGTDGPSEPSAHVDLRDLELQMIRAEAAAQEARNRLLEATISAGQRGPASLQSEEQ